MSTGAAPDLVCFSHLRWSFVFQRPQHLMTRFAARRRVYFVEEPVFEDGPEGLRVERTPKGVTLVVPHFAPCSPEQAWRIQRDLLSAFFAEHRLRHFAAWYYTPMALSFTAHLRPQLVVYDCMDELSAFTGAPPDMAARERELLALADVVFTGGRSLYESKQHRHSNVHLFPSSVDAEHFRRARTAGLEPVDQAALVGPRIGYAGVIDERLDLPLLAAVAAHEPRWQLVMLGPVAKIDPRTLPVAPNIHYLGMKPYDELPNYLRGWDVGMLPFARNEATRFISPTKTPEYLAAGLPVVATSIRDVVRPYGDQGLAHIADEAPDFVRAVEAALTCDRAALHRRAEALLATMSWDRTARSMTEAMADAWSARRGVDSAVAAR
jgi:glycosyltransferase involved in cell wall biosynthesis